MVNVIFLVAGLLLMFCGPGSAHVTFPPIPGIPVVQQQWPTTPPPQTADVFNALKARVVKDATWALNDAKAHPDNPDNADNIECYQSVISWLTGPLAPQFRPPELGVFSAAQIMFDVQGGVQTIFPRAVRRACAQTVVAAGLDIQTLFNRAGLLALIK